MHIIFIPYGKRSLVELLLRDMEAQKHLMIMKKEGQEDQKVWVQGVIRALPFGFFEYIVPKEAADMVLTTLEFDKSPYNIPEIIMSQIKKFLKAEKIPDFKKDKKFLWVKENVSIIPIGIKYDGELTEQIPSIYAGWVHEAL